MLTCHGKRTAGQSVRASATLELGGETEVICIPSSALEAGVTSNGTVAASALSLFVVNARRMSSKTVEDDICTGFEDEMIFLHNLPEFLQTSDSNDANEVRRLVVECCEAVPQTTRARTRRQKIREEISAMVVITDEDDQPVTCQSAQMLHELRLRVHVGWEV